jgi:hypothetical protein
MEANLEKLTPQKSSSPPSTQRPHTEPVKPNEAASARKNRAVLRVMVETGCSWCPLEIVIMLKSFTSPIVVNERTTGHAAKKYDSIAFPLIGAGSGGGKPAKILDMIQDELATIDFNGDVVIVRYLKNAR